MEQKLEQKQTFEPFEVSGQAQGAVGAIITLVVGVAVATLILIFVGALGGQTYNLVEPDINSINNTTIQNSVKNSIGSGFEALEQTGDYMPIIVLAVIISVVLALVLGFTAFGQGGGGRGSAL